MKKKKEPAPKSWPGVNLSSTKGAMKSQPWVASLRLPRDRPGNFLVKKKATGEWVKRESTRKIQLCFSLLVRWVGNEWE